MSAESPRLGRSSGGSSSGGVGGDGVTVAATPPPDRSLIHTVSGFINDVKLTATPQPDPKDVIQWAHFETVDINEALPEGEQDSDRSPVILALGYGQGVQVWSITPNGDAKEVLSWRQGVVRVLRLLSTPIGTDHFAQKRPLIALCDSSSPGTSFCSLSFISLRSGDQVKSIKFKNPILDVLSNKKSIVVSFAERFAVFDAGTLEDRLTITTCYPCPCPLGGVSFINPLALGDRWLAYADKKLIPAKRSSGGCETDGVPSYTASVLNAAKSLGKGLRGLSESVACSLAGAKPFQQTPSSPTGDHHHPGVVTILDIENQSEDEECGETYDPIVAHFVAHSNAIIALKFDQSGMLLVTADKRGHDFHVFRIHPHPFCASLAAIHHLYVLHRGDTTAKVQDIALSLDSRWIAVSTLRGTTHVFPINPYGGATNTRTHTQPRVVNRLSRFQRSAGLPLDRPHSPICDGLGGGWFPNPRLLPYPAPTHTSALAHLRATPLPTHTITRTSSGRQRLSSTSEDSGVLLARAYWAPRATPHTNSTHSPQRNALYSLYVLGAGGQLIHYTLLPKASSSVSREKVCEDTSIEVECEPSCAWNLGLRPVYDLPPPLSNDSPLLATRGHEYRGSVASSLSDEERWLSQVEILTHAGPHRRLWMGPQFVFKTYNTNMGSAQSLLEECELESTRSAAVSVPARPHPLLLHSGSTSSLEHSPSDRKKSFEGTSGRGIFNDIQLKEDLAEAMKETEGRVKAARQGSEETCVSNEDESSFRFVRCAPTFAPSPPLPAVDLGSTQRHLPATAAPFCPASNDPSLSSTASSLPVSLLLPVALADHHPPADCYIPPATRHDPTSQYEIPSVLFPPSWPQLEIKSEVSTECHDSMLLKNQDSDDFPTSDWNPKTRETSSPTFEIDLTLKTDSENILFSTQEFDEDFEVEKNLILKNLTVDDEDNEVETILNIKNVTVESPISATTVPDVEENKTMVVHSVQPEEVKVKVKRSKKSKGKTNNSKNKATEKEKIDETCCPKADTEAVQSVETCKPPEVLLQAEQYEKVLTNVSSCKKIEQDTDETCATFTRGFDLEVEDNNIAMVIKEQHFEEKEVQMLKNAEIKVQQAAISHSKCYSNQKGPKSEIKIPKVKSWSVITQESIHTPQQRCKTESPPLSWSDIAAKRSTMKHDLEIKTSEVNIDKKSLTNIDCDFENEETGDGDIETSKIPELTASADVDHFTKNPDIAQTSTVPCSAKNDFVEVECHSNNDKIKSRHKKKKDFRKVQTPPGNSSDSDFGVINDDEVITAHSITTKLAQIYKLNDVVVAQCVDNYSEIASDHEDDTDGGIEIKITDGFFDSASNNRQVVTLDNDKSELTADLEIEISPENVCGKIDMLHSDSQKQIVNITKSSDEDYTSPIVSSQTDSDNREERKKTETVTESPILKPASVKKKSKKKKR